MAAVTGAADAVADLLGLAGLPPGSEVLGPVPAPDGTVGQDGHDGQDAQYGPGRVRALVRAPRAAGMDLARGLRAAQAARSPRKDAGPVRVQLDPADVI
jgi:primosomal protein N' (replication factor Y)